MRPEMFADILGATFVRQSGDVVLQVGKKSYDRFALGELGCPQLKAARALHLVLQRLSIRTPDQLAARVHELADLKGIGHAAFYVALALLHEWELEEAARADYRAAATRNGHTVTFSTLKARSRHRRRRHLKQTQPRRDRR
jgi:hypothetical protein